MSRASGNDFGEKHKQTPQVNLQKADAHSPPEACKLVTQAGMAKAALPWADLIVKSFLGGVFISLGGLFDLIVAGGAPGLRASNPSIATLLAAFVFPLGFVLVILTNTELATSNMFIMVCTLSRELKVMLTCLLGVHDLPTPNFYLGLVEELGRLIYLQSCWCPLLRWVFNLVVGLLVI
jgi:hypothetical protein